MSPLPKPRTLLLEFEVPGFFVGDIDEAAAFVAENGGGSGSIEDVIDETLDQSMNLMDDEVVIVFRVSEGEKNVGEHLQPMAARLVRRRLIGERANARVGGGG